MLLFLLNSPHKQWRTSTKPSQAKLRKFEEVITGVRGLLSLNGGCWLLFFEAQIMKMKFLSLFYYWKWLIQENTQTTMTYQKFADYPAIHTILDEIDIMSIITP